MDNKVAKKYGEVKIERVERKWCGYSKALKLSRKAYNKTVRQYGKQLCRAA
jgi:hypothetical protein